MSVVPDSLQPALANLFSTAFVCGMNFVVLIYYSRKAFQPGWVYKVNFAALLLSLIKNITLVLLSGSTTSNCGVTASIEFFVFITWGIVNEAIILLRAYALSYYPKITLGVVGTLWAARLAVGYYMGAKITVTSKPGEICVWETDWTLSDPIFGLRLASEMFMLLVFCQRALAIRNSMKKAGQRERSESYNQLIINSICVTFVTCAAFIVTTQISIIPAIFPYNNSIFVWDNWLDSMAVLFLLDDTKKKITVVSRNNLSSMVAKNANTSVVGRMMDRNVGASNTTLNNPPKQ